jgi:Family of unknown function (DUF5995)
MTDDQGLIAALSAAPATSIDDVLAVMHGIDATLSDGDGLKWFNLLYMTVTRSVLVSATSSAFEDSAWVGHLDVVFANLYFSAAAASVTGGGPAAWRPLFEARSASGIARIQFALAGMNAHINHDLPLALVQTHRDRGTAPERQSDHYHDYTGVNAILGAVETEVKPILLTGVLRRVDGTLGPLDDVVAMWNVGKAREAAWANSAALWYLQGAPPVRAAFVDALDASVGLASRGLLVRTQI